MSLYAKLVNEGDTLRRPNRATAQAERDRAVAQVEDHADTGWRARALDAVQQTALRRADFIVDDVWEVGGLDSTREDRALGPVMLEARRRGWIQKTDRVRPSVRSHCSGKPVWTSLIYGGRP